MKVGLVWTVWEQEEVLPAIASGVYARDRHEVYWEQECKLYGGDQLLLTEAGGGRGRMCSENRQAVSACTQKLKSLLFILACV